MKKFLYYSFTVLTFLACSKAKDQVSPPVTSVPETVEFGKMTVETPKEVVSKEIGPSGGEISIDAIESGIKGLKITIPVNSYSENKVYKVSSTKIVKHNLGKFFNPISPLITISNGGGYSDGMIKLTIPIKLPDNHFAIALAYNSDTDSFNFLPLLRLSKDQIFPF